MNTIQTINDQKDLRQSEKSQLYINIFWEEPWNEWYECTSCGKLFWLSQVNESQKCICGNPLKAFYNTNEVERDRSSRADKQWYIGKLAETLDNKLVGFVLGRKTNIWQLNQEKLGLDTEQMKRLTQNIAGKYSNFDLESFFYFAEIWVDKQVRGMKVASTLYQQREKEMRKTTSSYTLLRTTKTTDTPYKRFQAKWFIDIFSYNDDQDRVIMIKNSLSSNY